MIVVVSCMLIAASLTSVFGAGDQCTDNGGCNATIGQICWKQNLIPGCNIGSCSCPDSRTYTDSSGRCNKKHKTHGVECAHNMECLWPTGLTCDSATDLCACPTGSTWNGKMCLGTNYIAVGNTCNAKTDRCVASSGYDETLGLYTPIPACVGSTCICDSAYKFSATGTDCILRVKVKEGDSCEGTIASGISNTAGTGGLCIWSTDTGNQLVCASDNTCQCNGTMKYTFINDRYGGFCKESGSKTSGQICQNHDDCGSGLFCVSCGEGEKKCSLVNSATGIKASFLLAATLSILWKWIR